MADDVTEPADDEQLLDINTFIKRKTVRIRYDDDDPGQRFQILNPDELSLSESLQFEALLKLMSVPNKTMDQARQLEADMRAFMRTIVPGAEEVLPGLRYGLLLRILESFIDLSLATPQPARGANEAAAAIPEAAPAGPPTGER
jgi:hypothetical protein